MKIELGCGKAKHEGFIGVDSFPFDGVDIIADITEKLPFEDNSVDHVYTQDVLEHIPQDKKISLMNEIWRILKHDGIMEHYVPNAGSRNDFGSPSHISHWNLQQFEHLDIDSYRYRVDHDYEGFNGAFQKVLAEEVNWQDEYGIKIPQSIHVIYRAVKEEKK
jgi:predicted SAM-dependent methyltransferase